MVKSYWFLRNMLYYLKWLSKGSKQKAQLNGSFRGRKVEFSESAMNMWEMYNQFAIFNLPNISSFLTFVLPQISKFLLICLSWRKQNNFLLEPKLLRQSHRCDPWYCELIRRCSNPTIWLLNLLSLENTN